MYEIAWNRLADSRKQLHWASQLLSAAADAKLSHAEDDSHSNLGWNAAEHRLEGRGGVSLDLNEPAVRYEGSLFELNNHTLQDAANWLAEQLDAELKFRDYEMPAHEVASGGLFQIDSTVSTVASDWFTFGQVTLKDFGDLRVWPHHFDLGFWNPGATEGKSIGGGFSLGDPHFELPYFYINAYGIERPENLPILEHGAWAESWVGAILTAEQIEPQDAENIADSFVRNANEICQQLINA